MSDPFEGLPRGHYGAIYADPPWKFYNWSKRPYWERSDHKTSRAVEKHYDTMSVADMGALPVADLAAESCVLFMWVCWPTLREAIDLIEAWGFEYKTCAFSWTKGDASQIEFFRDDITPYMGMGYWTRANSEMCLLATRGNPKRLNADVRQAIVEPKREHSRKPDCVYERIERLVEGPYLELWARQSTRPNWHFWGNEVQKFNEKNVVLYDTANNG